MVVRDAIRNPLVLRMTEAEREFLHLERIELRKGDVLGRINEPHPYYIFMERGLVAVVVTMSDDRSCKIGHVLHPGVVGVSSFFLTDRATANYVVVLPGEGLRAPRERLRQVVSRNSDLTALFTQLGHVAWVICGQASACNRLHELEQRLCTWLTLASTAIETDILPMNQTEIATNLGVTRKQVGLIVQKLTAAGLVRMLPGQPWRISLVDKPGIEASACECYQTITQRFGTIITNASRKSDFFMNAATHVSPGRRRAGLRQETKAPTEQAGLDGWLAPI